MNNELGCGDTLHRKESWGELVYSKERDSFSALVDGELPEVPDLSAPIGVAWVYTAPCNLRCIHCYGNVEELPKDLGQMEQRLAVANHLADVGVMRVVICGGEPTIRRDVFPVMEALIARGVSVVLASNGSLLQDDHLSLLSRLTRLELSLDGNQETHNRIRPSKDGRLDSWEAAIEAIKRNIIAGVQVKVLTTINSINQAEIPDIAEMLADIGVTDWKLSHTVPAGRARPIFSWLRVDESISVQLVGEVQSRYPGMHVKLSTHAAQKSRFYALVLPDNSFATEDIELGGKVSFGSLPKDTVYSGWNSREFNFAEHFDKWVDRVEKR